MGTISAYLASPVILDSFGWRNLFFIYGAVGSLWLVPWLSLATDTPEEAERKRLSLPVDNVKQVVDEESGKDANSIQAIWRATTEEGAKIINEAPLKEMLKSNGVRAMAIAHAASNWGLYNNLAWSPTFYSEQYGLNVKESALFSILPSIAGATCGILSALVADKFIAEGADLTLIRRIFQGIGLLGPATCLLTLAHDIPEAPIAAQLLLTGSVGFQAFNAAGFGAASQEKAGDRWAGLLYSLTSLPGVAFGSIGVYITGRILDSTGQWDLVFGLNGIVNVIAAAYFITFYESKKEFD
uniref:Major facilitator superfamily (MFS) profile domain-containing protein n=1 Tax=Leptocylindrus danicus TaxID=163516 RepID=A0A7S2P8K2_9STRA